MFANGKIVKDVVEQFQKVHAYMQNAKEENAKYGRVHMNRSRILKCSTDSSFL